MTERPLDIVWMVADHQAHAHHWPTVWHTALKRPLAREAFFVSRLAEGWLDSLGPDPEDGRLRRRLEIGVAGVPGPTTLQGLVAAGAPVGGMICQLLDHVEARQAPGRGDRRPRPAQVLDGANEHIRPLEGLAPKAQHHLVGEDGLELRARGGVGRPAQVEARHLGAESRIKSKDFHGAILPMT